MIADPSIDFSVQNANCDAAERASGDISEKVKKIMGSVAPNGLSSVTLTGGSNAAEQAVFEALIQRGTDTRFSVLGFKCSHHGDSLAFTQFAHPNVSVGLGWPCIDYPKTASEEEQSLSAVKQALDAKRMEGNPVGAIIIEPTNSGKGHTVSANFV